MHDRETRRGINGLQQIEHMRPSLRHRLAGLVIGSVLDLTTSGDLITLSPHTHPHSSSESQLSFFFLENFFNRNPLRPTRASTCRDKQRLFGHPQANHANTSPRWWGWQGSGAFLQRLLGIDVALPCELLRTET